MLSEAVKVYLTQGVLGVTAVLFLVLFLKYALKCDKLYTELLKVTSDSVKQAKSYDHLSETIDMFGKITTDNTNKILEMINKMSTDVEVDRKVRERVQSSIPFRAGGEE